MMIMSSTMTTCSAPSLVLTMDSNVYTEILDEQYEKLLKERKDKSLQAKFKKECEETPYLQQCKMYDD